MIWVAATIPVAQQSVVAKGIVIRSVRSLSNRERYVTEHLGFENALWTDKRNPYVFEMKSGSEDLTRQHVTVSSNLIGQPLKSGCSYSRIVRTIEHKALLSQSRTGTVEEDVFVVPAQQLPIRAVAD